MIKIENVETEGWMAAIRGMRNPLNSWEKSDSCWNNDFEFGGKWYEIGPNDLDLMKRLRKAGTDHRKYMRMITVYLDVTAPLYWWKEFDTYKVGTVANSCSTMHKIHAKEFTIDDFSHEKLTNMAIWRSLYPTIETLNFYRDIYVRWDELQDSCVQWDDDISCKKDAWYHMIQLLPSSYNQKRTVMLNYEVLANIYKSRKNHKLDEWHKFCNFIEMLPYSELITGEDD